MVTQEIILIIKAYIMIPSVLNKHYDVILKFHDLNKELHNTFGPAEVTINKNVQKFWFYHGFQHRKNGPAVVEYDVIGTIILEIWYNYGKKHRLDGPAIIVFFNNGNKKYETWFKNDKYNRLDGPFGIDYYENGNKKCEVWYNENGYRHRNNKPALLNYYENGNIQSESWYKNGILFRNRGPTHVEYTKKGKVI